MPLVLLLRTGRENIFCDQDSIPPGKRWREEIEAAISRSERMIIFWSANSSESQEVSFELELAFSAGKEIVPVLLDDAPLHDGLKPYQWIDARSYVQHLKPTLAISRGSEVASVFKVGHMPGLGTLFPTIGMIQKVVSAVAKKSTFNETHPLYGLIIEAAGQIVADIGDRIGLERGITLTLKSNQDRKS